MGILPRTATTLGKRVTVDTTADRLDTAAAASSQRVSILAVNRGSVTAYLGASDVTSAAGFQMDPGDSVAIDLAPGGTGLYAITAASSTTIHVLQAEVN